jgi:hypothetical protein
VLVRYRFNRGRDSEVFTVAVYALRSTPKTCQGIDKNEFHFGMFFEIYVKVRISLCPLPPLHKEIEARIVEGPYLLKSILQTARRVL